MKKILCVVLMLVMCITCLTACSGGGFTKPVEAAIQLTYYGNADALQDAFPEEYFEWYEDLYDEDLYDEYVDDWEDDNWDDIYEGKIRVSYKISNKEKVSESKLDEIKEHLDDYYDISSSDVKEAYRFDVVYTIKADGETDTNDYEDMYSVKIRDNWYMMENYDDFYCFSCDAW